MLAHLTAWWEDCCLNIKAILDNPEFILPEYDMDRYNAEVIQKNKGRNKEEIIHEFEVERRKLFDLVTTLADAQILLEGIQMELFLNTTDHYKDHGI